MKMSRYMRPAILALKRGDISAVGLMIAVTMLKHRRNFKLLSIVLVKQYYWHTALWYPFGTLEAAIVTGVDGRPVAPA
jgi:hypothetical protein